MSTIPRLITLALLTSCYTDVQRVPIQPIPPRQACSAYAYQGNVYDCSVLDGRSASTTEQLACCECDPFFCSAVPLPEEEPLAECVGVEILAGASCLEVVGEVTADSDEVETLYTGGGQVVAVDASDPIEGAVVLTPTGCEGIASQLQVVDAEERTWVIGIAAPEGTTAPTFAVGEWLSWRYVEVADDGVALALYDADGELAFLHERLGPDSDPLHRGFDATTTGECQLDAAQTCHKIAFGETAVAAGNGGVLEVPGTPRVVVLDACGDEAGPSFDWMAWPSR